MDCSPPGSSVHGIIQARILDWVAISFFRGSSRSGEQACVSCIGRQILYHWATREAHYFSEKSSKSKTPSILLLCLTWHASHTHQYRPGHGAGKNSFPNISGLQQTFSHLHCKSVGDSPSLCSMFFAHGDQAARKPPIWDITTMQRRSWQLSKTQAITAFIHNTTPACAFCPSLQYSSENSSFRANQWI